MPNSACLLQQGRHLSTVAENKRRKTSIFQPRIFLVPYSLQRQFKYRWVFLNQWYLRLCLLVCGTHTHQLLDSGTTQQTSVEDCCVFRSYIWRRVWFSRRSSKACCLHIQKSPHIEPLIAMSHLAFQPRSNWKWHYHSCIWWSFHLVNHAKW